jgi:hypothetical protein
LWWLGGQYPVFDGKIGTEISSPVEAADPGTPIVVEAMAEPPTATPIAVAAPVESPMVASEPRRGRTRKPVPRPTLPPVAQLSLVQVTDVAPMLVPGIRAAVGQRLEALRDCCESVMRGSAVKGAIAVEITTRDGAVTAIDIDSTSRDASLRWCFRKHLMGARMPSTSRAFDARLEFFLTPRARHAAP